MYLQHFNFREYPFSLTPDTEFFFEYASHCDALNVLCAALRAGEGFIKVTGEIGLGKTLLCRLLLRRLGPDFATAWLPDPQLSPRALRIALAEELDVFFDEHWTDQQLMGRIRQRLVTLARNGRQVALLIDEAHQLPEETLEAVRLLTNLETEKAKLLQVVIFGQPELDRRLQTHSLRQLRQRITFSCVLEPLDRVATETYVCHRLTTAGNDLGRLFTTRAMDTVYFASKGTPRLVNILCHKALMLAYGRGERTVHRAEVYRAAEDTEGAARPKRLDLARILSWTSQSRRAASEWQEPAA